MLMNETENKTLQAAIATILDDIQGGVSLSQAMIKHPNIFSKFYVNMVRSAEESGKLDETFSYLADYLERSYETTAKAKNAMIYPAFIISALIIVLILMMIYVIPNLTTILTEAAQDIPFYTRIMIGASNFFRNYGVYVLIVLAIGGYFLLRYKKTEKGKIAISHFVLSLPLFGGIFKKFYISRITDNLETSLSSGISMVRALEISADVAGENIYGQILESAVTSVKAGEPLSSSLAHYKEVPSIVCQMIKIGEETGKLNFILKTLSRFYRKEVDNAVDTLVGMIEPAMIIVLGTFVGVFILAVLGPIYSLTSAM
jgi:type IV pilus assembly protein PilC